MRRKQPPALPELSQPQVLRHYLRLSQENLGADLNIEIGQGTCTMKYSPKINDQLACHPKVAELHPLQDEETVQGILEIMYRFEQILKEISGMDRFSLQPPLGRQRSTPTPRSSAPTMSGVGRGVSATKSSPPSSPTPPMRPARRRPASRSSPFTPMRTATPTWTR
jgi:hypothetical protein